MEAKFLIITILMTCVALRGTCDQIVIPDGLTFWHYFNTSRAPFQSATSPEEIGLSQLAGWQILYLKSYLHTDNNIDFSSSFDLPRWICKGTQVQINIRYFSSLASVTVWPIVDKNATHGGSSYANLVDFNGGWVNFVADIDIERSEQVMLDGVIMPMGHFLLDEIIFLYTGEKCNTDGTTQTLETDTTPLNTDGWITDATVA